MRLLDIEKPLKKAISDYIEEVYPYTKDDRPGIKVLDDEEFTQRCIYKGTDAFYDIPRNTLYFREHPIAKHIAHEIEHWAQAQEVGPNKYMRQLEDHRVFFTYEHRADEVALANAPKLKW